jgi:hypothetical protein
VKGYEEESNIDELGRCLCTEGERETVGTDRCRADVREGRRRTPAARSRSDAEWRRRRLGPDELGHGIQIRSGT